MGQRQPEPTISIVGPFRHNAIVGMRRAGKTTFLWQVLAERLAAGTPREGLLYFSFEDERLAGMSPVDLPLVVEEYYRLNPEWREKRRAVFLFDEIQNVPGWHALETCAFLELARRALNCRRKWRCTMRLSGCSSAPRRSRAGLPAPARRCFMGV